MTRMKPIVFLLPMLFACSLVGSTRRSESNIVVYDKLVEDPCSYKDKLIETICYVNLETRLAYADLEKCEAHGIDAYPLNDKRWQGIAELAITKRTERSNGMPYDYKGYAVVVGKVVHSDLCANAVRMGAYLDVHRISLLTGEER